jgi:biopolymer transport protein ExbB
MTSAGLFAPLIRFGGTWVIWLLVLASVLTVAVLIERAIELARERRGLAYLKAAVLPLLNQSKLAEAASAVRGARGSVALVLQAGLARAAGAASAEERMGAARLEARYRLERRLWILGTLGNNAPFIGLFGTVLGVIKAFADLGAAAQAGPEVVMIGLSEALIATAVGLLVAIPAVIAFNYFMKRAGELLMAADGFSKTLLAAMKETRAGESLHGGF